MPGSMATGLRKEVAMSGCLDAGTTRPIKVLAGFARVIGIINKAGSCEKGTGIATSTEDGDKINPRWSLVLGSLPMLSGNRWTMIRE